MPDSVGKVSLFNDWVRLYCELLSEIWISKLEMLQVGRDAEATKFLGRSYAASGSLFVLTPIYKAFSAFCEVMATVKGNSSGSAFCREA